MTNYWLIVHDLPSYQQHPNKIGLSKGHAEKDKIFRTIKNGDRIIYYAKNKEALGIFKVVSDMHPSDRGCWGGKAGDHFVYDIEPVYVSPIGMPTPIDTTKHGIKSLHGRTAVRLTHSQFKDIKSEILGMDDPISESGVVCMFSKMHQFLGFPFLKSIQNRFPDCVAVNNSGKEVKIEFEEPSDKFDHDPKKCDLVVCWKDTLGSLSEVQILELSDFVYGH
jgi:hypothetical protein